MATAFMDPVPLSNFSSINYFHLIFVALLVAVFTTKVGNPA